MENNKLTKILITGVHSTPALSVMDELQKRGYSNFVWVGQKYSIIGNKTPTLEYRIIKDKNIPFVNLITGKLQRSIDYNFIKWIIRIPVGVFQSLYVILKYKPEIVVTFGSHVGVPISFWAWVLRIPVIDHEQTTTQGLSNQIISKFATKVCFSWRESHKESNKYIYSGNPIVKDRFKSTTNDINFADTSKKTILFTAGNQGSRQLNQIIFGAAAKLCKKYNIIHQTGANPTSNDFSYAQSLAEGINDRGIKYIPLLNFTGGEVFSKSDIVVSRSGANTVYDIAALGKIALFIPIPNSSKDEQTKNAHMLVNTGTAKILRQQVLTIDTLIEHIDKIDTTYETMSACIDKSKSLIVLDADVRIVNIIEENIKAPQITEPKVTKESDPKKPVVKKEVINKEVKPTAKPVKVNKKSDKKIMTKETKSTTNTKNTDNFTIQKERLAELFSKRLNELKELKEKAALNKNAEKIQAKVNDGLSIVKDRIHHLKTSINALNKKEIQNEVKDKKEEKKIK
ncbi:MAG: UDP-N-acetylglucosamine--N-acetylmuramyl-(pentapeptide) pyrophosphoryl-undecaprenol N-acetylglucosamine transferase [bacterium]